MARALNQTLLKNNNKMIFPYQPTPQNCYFLNPIINFHDNVTNLVTIQTFLWNPRIGTYCQQVRLNRSANAL